MANGIPLEKELLALEKRFWQAMKDHDVDTAVALTDFPCIVSGASGVSRVDKAAFTKMMKSHSYRIDDVQLSDAQARMLADDVAVLAYTVHEHLTIDGKPVTVDAADASTWVRRNGRWLCALHTEAIVGDPFGRGRDAKTS